MPHSQGQEEIYILQYFKGKTGTYADFGSNDGVIYSNTYALALQGWSGYAIEASKKAFEQLEKNYHWLRRIKLFNLAITADKEGEITFFESGTHINQGDVSLLSTVKEGELKRWEGSSNQFEKTTAIAMPFDKFYAELPDKKIECISLDIEGLELEVAAKMNFTEMETKLICIEWNSKDKHLYDEIILPFGFKLIHQNAENLIYVL